MSTPGYKLITTPDELSQAVAVLREAPHVGFDTETTGLDPHTSRVRLMQLATPQASYVIDVFRLTPAQLKPVLDLLAAPTPLKIAHNAKFDAKFVLRHYGVRLGAVFDTYLASLLISAGDENARHGLEPVALRYLDIQLDKAAQLSDWSGELTAYQLEYAARDAAVLLPLRERMEARLLEMDLMVAAELEFDCVLPLAAMELAGVYLDADCWRAQVNRVRAEYNAVAEELQRELSAGAAQMSLFAETQKINLDSPAQVKEALARLGIEVETTREWRMQKLAQQYPVIQRLLDYRGLSKSLGSYGEGMLDYINSATGRIHANFHQIGTPTGRISCSSPSLQQVPHAIEYRSCFRAPQGRKLVVADYCVAKGTRVATRRGLIAIEAMQVGDQVFLEDGRTAPVAAVISRGALPVVTVTLKNGYSLTATSLHRIRVLDAEGDYIWRRIRELEPTDRVAIQPGRGLHDELSHQELPLAISQHLNNHRQLRTPTYADERAAVLMGYLSGDGSFKIGALTWVVNDQDADLAALLKQWAEDLFGISVHSCGVYRGVFEYGLYSRPLINWCARVEVSKGQVPGFLWQSHPAIVAAYLRGLFESDGSVTNNETGKVSFASSRERLAREVHQLLLALGIPSTLRHQCNIGPEHRFNVWIVSILSIGLKQFSEQIGFLSVRKRNKLAALVKRWTGKTIVGNMPNLQEKARSLKLSGEIRRLLANTSSLGRPVSQSLALSLETNYPGVADKLGLKHITEYKQLFLPIISIKPAGEQEVYDLSVPGPMTYISDGFVSHNSQIEMRVLADFSRDEALLAAFASGADLHRATASQMLGIALDQVTPEERSQAKGLNYGLIYGMGAERLGNRINVSTEEAEHLMERYFAAYPGVARWLRDTAEQAAREGRSRTASGRLWIYHFDVNDRQQLAALKRVGKNTPIQGCGSDIFKRAMKLVDDALLNRDAQIINSIHDEIVVECAVNIAEETARIVSQAMVAAAKEFLPTVPVIVDAIVADAWVK